MSKNLPLWLPRTLCSKCTNQCDRSVSRSAHLLLPPAGRLRLRLRLRCDAARLLFCAETWAVIVRFNEAEGLNHSRRGQSESTPALKAQSNMSAEFIPQERSHPPHARDRRVSGGEKRT